MEQKKRLNVANGVISGMVVFCGLIAATMGVLAESSTYFYCFAYIIPGMFGIVATAAKRTGLHITHMVLCVIILCSMAIGSFQGILQQSVCSATNFYDSYYSTSARARCKAVYAGIQLAIFILAWLLTFANTVMAGILSARRQETQPTIIQQDPQMTTGVQMNTARVVSPQNVTPQSFYWQPNGANMTYMTPEGGYVTPSNPTLPQYHEVPPPQYHEVPPPQYHEVPSPQYHEVPSPQYHEVPPPQYHEVPPTQYHEVPPTQYNEVPSSQYLEVPPLQYHEVPPTQQFDEGPPQYHDTAGLVKNAAI